MILLQTFWEEDFVETAASQALKQEIEEEIRTLNIFLGLARGISATSSTTKL